MCCGILVGNQKLPIIKKVCSDWVRGTKRENIEGVTCKASTIFNVNPIASINTNTQHPSEGYDKVVIIAVGINRFQ